MNKDIIERLKNFGTQADPAGFSGGSSPLASLINKTKVSSLPSGSSPNFLASTVGDQSQNYNTGDYKLDENGKIVKINDPIELAFTKERFNNPPVYNPPVTSTQPQTGRADISNEELSQSLQDNLASSYEASLNRALTPQEALTNLINAREKLVTGDSALGKMGSSPSAQERVYNADKSFYDKQLDNFVKNNVNTSSKGYGVSSILAGLPTVVGTQVLSYSKDFKSEPVVKSYNSSQRAALDTQRILDNIKTSGKSDAGDDMQLMYLFARAQDPDSVVRESEYNNVGEYFSSLPQNVQFQLSRVIGAKPTNKLTPQAQQAIAQAIFGKHQVDATQYKNVKSEYVDNIDLISGVPGLGDQLIIGYDKAYTPDSSSSSGSSGGGDSFSQGEYYQDSNGNWKYK